MIANRGRTGLERHRRLAVPVFLGAALACAAAGAQDQRIDTSPRAVVAAAVRYVADYQQQFAFLIADEHYTQTRLAPDGKPYEERRMIGELFLTYVAADRDWIAVHDVAEVNGRPVADRDDLRALLQQGAEVRGVAGRVAARNAAFNIGKVIRNFNEPTLALRVLDDDALRRFSFDRRAVEGSGEDTVVTLSFRERGRPTIVRGDRARDLESRGELAIEAATGRIRRTLFEVSDGPLRARLETVYAHEPRLDLWVPTTFTERYDLSRPGEKETVLCEAKYTDYRRFLTRGRIK
jgi:hypothetical protein